MRCKRCSKERIKDSIYCDYHRGYLNGYNKYKQRIERFLIGHLKTEETEI